MYSHDDLGVIDCLQGLGILFKRCIPSVELILLDADISEWSSEEYGSKFDCAIDVTHDIVLQGNRNMVRVDIDKR
jgi:hypothetical protein